MSDKTSQARRKLLRGIAVGGSAVVAGKSLPENWSRPVVDSVMLPAHAQTSMLNSSGPATPVNIARNDAGTDTLMARVSDTLLPAANAGGGIMRPAQVCIEHVREGGDSPDVANVKALVIFGDECPNSVMFTASNVPVNPGVVTPMNGNSLCRDRDASNLLQEFGLVKDAAAGEEMMSKDGVSIHTLNGPAGGAFGYLYIGKNTLKFDLPRGECPGFVPQCCEGEPG